MRKRVFQKGLRVGIQRVARLHSNESSLAPEVLTVGAKAGAALHVIRIEAALPDPQAFTLRPT
eukprot:10406680-Alexandrium_andersonii.AAC.1